MWYYLTTDGISRKIWHQRSLFYGPFDVANPNTKKTVWIFTEVMTHEHRRGHDVAVLKNNNPATLSPQIKLPFPFDNLFPSYRKNKHLSSFTVRLSCIAPSCLLARSLVPEQAPSELGTQQPNQEDGDIPESSPSRCIEDTVPPQEIPFASSLQSHYFEPRTNNLRAGSIEAFELATKTRRAHTQFWEEKLWPRNS